MTAIYTGPDTGYIMLRVDTTTQRFKTVDGELGNHLMNFIMGGGVEISAPCEHGYWADHDNCPGAGLDRTGIEGVTPVMFARALCAYRDVKHDRHNFVSPSPSPNEKRDVEKILRATFGETE